MFAGPLDLEPGMWFRSDPSCPPLLFGGVESVVSRFGAHRVRVVVARGGRSFVCDPALRFQVINFERRS